MLNLCLCSTVKGCSLLLSHSGPYTAFIPLLRTPLTVGSTSVCVCEGPHLSRSQVLESLVQ